MPITLNPTVRTRCPSRQQRPRRVPDAHRTAHVHQTTRATTPSEVRFYKLQNGLASLSGIEPYGSGHVAGIHLRVHAAQVILYIVPPGCPAPFSQAHSWQFPRVSPRALAFDGGRRLNAWVGHRTNEMIPRSRGHRMPEVCARTSTNTPVRGSSAAPATTCGSTCGQAPCSRPVS